MPSGPICSSGDPGSSSANLSAAERCLARKRLADEDTAERLRNDSKKKKRDFRHAEFIESKRVRLADYENAIVNVTFAAMDTMVRAEVKWRQAVHAAYTARANAYRHLAHAEEATARANGEAAAWAEEADAANARAKEEATARATAHRHLAHAEEATARAKDEADAANARAEQYHAMALAANAKFRAVLHRPPAKFRNGQAVHAWWAPWFPECGLGQHPAGYAGKQRPSWFSSEITTVIGWRDNWPYAGGSHSGYLYLVY